MAARFDVMDLQVFPFATELAFPSVTTEDLSPQLLVRFTIEADSLMFWK
jgi:hypothetical protein